MANEQTVFRIALIPEWDGVGDFDDPEMWTTAHGFPDYAVSTHGRVKRITKGKGTYPGRICKLTLDKKRKGSPSGYHRVGLTVNGWTKTVHVHQLVANSWIGPRPSGWVTAHWDDDGTNNRLWNLRYATYVENSEDAIRNGRVPIGERSVKSKLSAADVIHIRKLRRDGVPHRVIAKHFGITRSHSCRVALGRERSRG